MTAPIRWMTECLVVVGTKIFERVIIEQGAGDLVRSWTKSYRLVDWTASQNGLQSLLCLFVPLQAITLISWDLVRQGIECTKMFWTIYTLKAELQIVNLVLNG